MRFRGIRKIRARPLRKNDTHASTNDPDSSFYPKAVGRRPSFVILATPPWRTGMGWLWPAGSRMPMVPSNASFGDHAEGETQSRRPPLRTGRTIQPITSRIFVPFRDKNKQLELLASNAYLCNIR